MLHIPLSWLILLPHASSYIIFPYQSSEKRQDTFIHLGNCTLKASILKILQYMEPQNIPNPLGGSARLTATEGDEREYVERYMETAGNHHVEYKPVEANRPLVHDLVYNVPRVKGAGSRAD